MRFYDRLFLEYTGRTKIKKNFLFGYTILVQCKGIINRTGCPTVYYWKKLTKKELTKFELKLKQ